MDTRQSSEQWENGGAQSGFRALSSARIGYRLSGLRGNGLSNGINTNLLITPLAAEIILSYIIIIIICIK